MRALHSQVLQPECIGEAPTPKPEVCPATCKSRAGYASERAGSKYILDSTINDTSGAINIETKNRAYYLPFGNYINI